MAVEAVASQFSTRWSTLLPSSSTASGLRHHQQHRSMTSQPHPGPWWPACPHKTRQPAASMWFSWVPCMKSLGIWDQKGRSGSSFDCWVLVLTQLKQSSSRSSLNRVQVKFRPESDSKSSTGQPLKLYNSMHTKAHILVCLRVNWSAPLSSFLPVFLFGLNRLSFRYPLCFNSFPPRPMPSCPLLLPLACLLLSAALRLPADIYSSSNSSSSKDAQDCCCWR